jgi:hypothetical protein
VIRHSLRISPKGLSYTQQKDVTQGFSLDPAALTYDAM